MDLGLLHTMCKEDTRNAFNDFKRSIECGLFEFNNDVKDDLQNQLKQDTCNRTVKYFVNNYKLSKTQITYLSQIKEHYTQIALTALNNYCKRFL